MKTLVSLAFLLLALLVMTGVAAADGYGCPGETCYKVDAECDTGTPGSGYIYVCPTEGIALFSYECEMIADVLGFDDGFNLNPKPKDRDMDTALMGLVECSGYGLGEMYMQLHGPKLEKLYAVGIFGGFFGAGEVTPNTQSNFFSPICTFKGKKAPMDKCNFPF